MPLMVWSPVEPLEVDELHELARLTAEQIGEAEREAERQRLLPMIHRAFGHPSHMNPVYVGSWSDEDLYDYETDQWKPARLEVECRGCHRYVCPLLSKSRVVLEAGWHWVGLDHKEPFADYFFACGWCGTPMMFQVVTPQ